MLSKVASAAVHGIEAVPITVETNIVKGIPAFNVVGLVDTTVKEARERIRSALCSSGIEYPRGHIVVNMAPADIRKKGSHFDLAMAVGIMVSSNQLFDRGIENYCFIGELSLDGAVNKCDGILPMVTAMKRTGIKNAVVPRANRDEAALTQGMNILAVETLEEIIDHFNLNNKIKACSNIKYPVKKRERVFYRDFADVKGQEYAKRAVTVAASGGHGILMVGSPSTGKTMISERIPTIIPDMDYDEIVETTAVYSVAGLLNEGIPYVTERPFRRPHHSITRAGLLGGGVSPRPGEITLAHNGVLFLDEVGEFDKNIIEMLRLPLEKKKISIIRQNTTYIFPADFMVVAATNPCKCGYYGDPEHQCKCSQKEIDNYISRLSGPILDRIDMHISLQPVEYNELNECETKSSEEMRAIIERARRMQEERYSGTEISLNHQLEEHLTEIFCVIDKEGREMLSKAYTKLKLNPRTLLKVKKLARTIADIDGTEGIKQIHIAEALQYREKVI